MKIILTEIKNIASIKTFKLVLFFTLASLNSCMPVVEEDLSNIDVSWQDSTIRKIYNLVDKRDTESLLPYLRHKDATYRYFAVQKMLSIEDSTIIDSVAVLLNDQNEDIRIAAVKTLAQTKSQRAEIKLIDAFEANDTNGIHTSLNRHILEAIGWCGGKEQLNNIATISTYTPKDTSLLLGQAWAVYRFAIRGHVIPEGTKLMIEFLKSSIYSERVRGISANYLYRVKNLNLKKHTSSLIRAFNIETNPEIKQYLALALGKTKNKSALTVLKNTLETEKDYRVKCNIIRAFGNFKYESCRTEVIELLKSSNRHISKTAGNYFVQHGTADDALDYKDFAKDTTIHDVARTKMYAATMKHLPFYYSLTLNGLRYRLTKWFNESHDPYLKVSILEALSEDPKNYKFIFEKGFSDPHSAVKTASTIALKTIFESQEFDLIFGGFKNWRRKEFVQYFHTMFRSKDVGVVAELAPVLSSKSYDFKAEKESFLYLDSMLHELSLPKAIETYNILNKNISYLKGVKFTAKKVAFNNAIDWRYFKRVSDKTTATINTTKGAIEISFDKEYSPASVINFIKLANEGFYNGKSFHRVVSNFVIQTGCSRGDGYGSLNQTIRTELESSRYDNSGKIGMASAGRNTEAAQWFITHVPTPFLDGNYTIFGNVTKGMAVVHRIQVGDIIRNITINNLQNEEDNTNR